MRHSFRWTPTFVLPVIGILAGGCARMPEGLESNRPYRQTGLVGFTTTESQYIFQGTTANYYRKLNARTYVVKGQSGLRLVSCWAINDAGEVQLEQDLFDDLRLEGLRDSAFRQATARDWPAGGIYVMRADIEAKAVYKPGEWVPVRENIPVTFKGTTVIVEWSGCSGNPLCLDMECDFGFDNLQIERNGTVLRFVNDASPPFVLDETER